MGIKRWLPLLFANSLACNLRRTGIRSGCRKRGRPFVIKHEFLTTNDHTGEPGLFGSLVNQFSEPVPASDEPMSQKWIQRAKETIRLIESILA
ncbi:YugN family protein [Thermoactinomyces mirandus]|uniref:Uncharacterized protein n=1 Tax=Thermoactinomyces mirandus TaxID=2756294 RepID=A0A7W1XU80_9BACL|nr:hypothetical protein [Thermoactinomyces mirandus]